MRPLGGHLEREVGGGAAFQLRAGKGRAPALVRVSRCRWLAEPSGQRARFARTGLHVGLRPGRHAGDELASGRLGGRRDGGLGAARPARPDSRSRLYGAGLATACGRRREGPCRPRRPAAPSRRSGVRGFDAGFRRGWPNAAPDVRFGTATARRTSARRADADIAARPSGLGEGGADAAELLETGLGRGVGDRGSAGPSRRRPCARRGGQASSAKGRPAAWGERAECPTAPFPPFRGAATPARPAGASPTARPSRAAAPRADLRDGVGPAMGGAIAGPVRGGSPPRRSRVGRPAPPARASCRGLGPRRSPRSSRPSARRGRSGPARWPRTGP